EIPMHEQAAHDHTTPARLDQRPHDGIGAGPGFDPVQPP
ncbi:hypothetical protein Pgy4_40325, partial [Pseudomonas savastanoi pv. glycinea str. race 4]